VTDIILPIDSVPLAPTISSMSILPGLDEAEVAINLVNAILRGKGAIRVVAVTSAILGIIGFFVLLSTFVFNHPASPIIGLVPLGLSVLGASVLHALQRAQDIFRSELRIERAEKQVADNPKEPVAAWLLARVTLESYLNRNLSQVRSIYMLTAAVMLVGFGLIIAGSVEAFMHPDRFHASVLSSLSGVAVSFIGGTFLVLHKSTMTQAKDYVTILERINAVGMSMQILDSLGSESDVLRRETTAVIAQQLLSMYSQHVPRLDYRMSKPSKTKDSPTPSA
jgi:hypothetical protein